MTPEADYTRRTYFRPGKTEPAKAETGLNDATLVFAVEGQAGAAALEILTGWFHPAGDFTPAEPGVYDLNEYPDGILGFHSRAELAVDPADVHGIHMQESCEALGGASCWGVTSSIAGAPLVRKLMTEGDEAVWSDIEDLYQQAFLRGRGSEHMEELRVRGHKIQEHYPIRYRGQGIK